MTKKEQVIELLKENQEMFGRFVSMDIKVRKIIAPNNVEGFHIVKNHCLLIENLLKDKLGQVVWEEVWAEELEKAMDIDDGK
ncbi:MAG: hypothetical protein KAS32_08610 [Candidatus Peribacteraceae bacterium]|nr:hypothetical protein [Candidatus Peribacteraceae bacterium]